jgi:large subunit ribosomal protein L13
LDSLTYKTISANKATVDKNWVIVDASGQALGRMCSKVAKLIRGKYKPSFINAEKITLSGNKWDNKKYIRYTGYPGGQRSLTAKELFAKDPARLIEKSVKGMLPKNKLGAALFRNLKVYVGENHKHEGQSPVLINLNDLK